VGNKDKAIVPWERQPGEGSEAFKAFSFYRDAQPKISMATVAEKYTKSYSLVRRWGARFNWKERREAWEDEQDRLTRLELVKGIAAMHKKHVDIAATMMLKAADALQQLPTSAMTPRDIATLVDTAAKLERLSRGEATERSENSQGFSGQVNLSVNPYEGLTTEELRRLAQLVDEPET